MNKKFMNNAVLDSEVEIRKLLSGGYNFRARLTVKSASAGDKLMVVSKQQIEQMLGKSPFVDGAGFSLDKFTMAVKGTTTWLGVVDVRLQTVEDVPQDLLIVPIASLTANNYITEEEAGITLSEQYKTKEKIVDDTVDSGECTDIVLFADSDGTAGDDLIVNIWGTIGAN